ncbi:MAG: hypothetical protein ACK41U_15780 [Paracoccus sp. (in: a-proteobacteria)]
MIVDCRYNGGFAPRPPPMGAGDSRVRTDRIVQMLHCGMTFAADFAYAAIIRMAGRLRMRLDAGNPQAAQAG